MILDAPLLMAERWPKRIEEVVFSLGFWLNGHSQIGPRQRTTTLPFSIDECLQSTRDGALTDPNQAVRAPLKLAHKT